MKFSITSITGFLIAVALISSCVKKADPVDEYFVTVDFRNSGNKYLTGNVELNPKDSIYLDFTVTSAKEDISVVEIQKNGTKLDTFKIPEGGPKRSFSGIKKYMSDSIAGDYTYRILARNSQGTYIG